MIFRILELEPVRETLVPITSKDVAIKTEEVRTHGCRHFYNTEVSSRKSEIFTHNHEETFSPSLVSAKLVNPLLSLFAAPSKHESNRLFRKPLSYKFLNWTDQTKQDWRSSVI